MGIFLGKSAFFVQASICACVFVANPWRVLLIVFVWLQWFHVQCNKPALLLYHNAAPLPACSSGNVLYGAVYSIRRRRWISIFVCFLFYLWRSVNHCCRLFLNCRWLLSNCGVPPPKKNPARITLFGGFVDRNVCLDLFACVPWKSSLTRLNFSCIQLCRPLLTCLLTWTTTTIFTNTTISNSNSNKDTQPGCDISDC